VRHAFSPAPDPDPSPSFDVSRVPPLTLPRRHLAPRSRSLVILACKASDSAKDKLLVQTALDPNPAASRLSEPPSLAFWQSVPAEGIRKVIVVCSVTAVDAGDAGAQPAAAAPALLSLQPPQGTPLPLAPSSPLLPPPAPPPGPPPGAAGALMPQAADPYDVSGCGKSRNLRLI
jgi:hypothetical protein